ncbi:MAG: tyrosine-type recombinase/integrase [Thermoplasmata archaeon]
MTARRKEVLSKLAHYCLNEIPSKKDRKIVEEYLVSLKAIGRKDRTIENHGCILRQLCEYSATLDKSIMELTENDLMSYFAGADFKESTLELKKHMTKQFFQAKSQADVVAWIKPRRIRKVMMPSDMLTPQDVRELVQVADSFRDKAIIAVLYESGMRSSEFLSTRIGDVVFTHRYARFILHKEATDLKTGRREIPLINSVVLLQQHIESHPLRDDPNAPMWFSSKEPDKSITSTTLLKLLYKYSNVSKKFKKKNINAHLFRHSRAYELAKRGWNEAQLRKFFGWTRTSNMPSYYAELSESDVMEKALQDAGIEEEAPEEENALAVKDCPLCMAQNDSTAMFCRSCGVPFAQSNRAVLPVVTVAEAARQSAAHTSRQIEQLGDFDRGTFLGMQEEMRRLRKRIEQLENYGP